MKKILALPAELYQNRKLVLSLAKNDFKTKYAGSYFGTIWAFIQPIVTICVYWFVFGLALRNGSDKGVPFVLWLIAGLVPWFFIPKNFAHGFVVLSGTAEFAYKCTDFYHPNDEGGLAYNDPDIGVEWPIPEGMELILSDKDQKWGSFKEYTANRSKKD